MDDPLVVGVLQGIADLRHDGQRLARRQTPGFEQLAQVHPVHELHEKVEQPVGLAELVERDDAGMVELGQRLGLAGEAFGKGRVVADARRQDFQGDDAVERLLPGFVDRAHAALADESQDFQLGKRLDQFFGCRRHEPGPTAFSLAVRPDVHAGAQPGFHQARRAQPVRRVRREGLLAAGTYSFAVSITVLPPVTLRIGRKR